MAEEIPVNPEFTGYSHLIMIYQDLSAFNTGRQFGFSNNLLAVARELLTNYYEGCMAYIEDDSPYKSLLHYTVGDDELEQWRLFKGVYQRYTVALF